MTKPKAPRDGAPSACAGWTRHAYEVISRDGGRILVWAPSASAAYEIRVAAYLAAIRLRGEVFDERRHGAGFPERVEHSVVCGRKATADDLYRQDV